jgi:uncharacterized SAM-binding protein YcdF (DUF218 family)
MFVLRILFISRRDPRTHRAIASRLRLWPAFFLLLTGFLTYRHLEGYFRQPQAILVLGGAPEREIFAAHFAHEHPDLPIWISSGAPAPYTESVFSEAGINLSRLHLNYEARNTVTNFTTLVDEFKARGFRSIYLITSDYHMRRAQVIGEIVLGSQDIDFKPVSVPSKAPYPESLDKTIRDAIRSLLWVTTGHTGDGWGQSLNELNH